MTMTELSRDDLVKQVHELKWFHAIDFGDVVSPARHTDGKAPNLTLFPVHDLMEGIDVRGMDCLDIGLGSGLTTFGLAKKGAKVTATDMGYISKTVALGQKLLDLDFTYVGYTSFDNILEKFEPHTFDLIICSGVMYHMLNPFDCILKARKLLKRDGLFVMETAYYSDVQTPTIDFTPLTDRSTEITTYCMPSKSALIGMMQLAGFDVLGIRNILVPDRIAILARNVDFSEVSNRPHSISRRHEFGIQDPALKPALPDQRSPIKWMGARSDRTLDWKTYRSSWPYQPKA